MIQHIALVMYCWVKLGLGMIPEVSAAIVSYTKAQFTCLLALRYAPATKLPETILLCYRGVNSGELRILSVFPVIIHMHCVLKL